MADDNQLLIGRQTFFATRLVQLRLQREGKWKTQVLARMPTQQQRFFSPEASDEEITQGRNKMVWQMNPGNWLLEFIKQQTPSKLGMALGDHIFNIGVAELNSLLISKRAGGRDARQP